MKILKEQPPMQDDKEVLKSSEVEGKDNEARKERIDKLQRELGIILFNLEKDFGVDRAKWPEEIQDEADKKIRELNKNFLEERETKSDKKTREELTKDYIRKLKEL